VRVLVREVTRSGEQLQREAGEIEHAMVALQRIVERGQADGTFRRDVNARLGAWIVYGALEEILTGWVMGQLPDGDDDVAEAERSVVHVLCDGFVA
jgi:hypothetical protein